MLNNTSTVHKFNEVLFKYQTSFMSEEDRSTYKEKLNSAKDKNRIEGTISQSCYKYCDECGKQHWNPQFQINEVKYCTLHNVRLKRSRILGKNGAVSEHSNNEVYTDAYKEHLIWIANQINVILERHSIKRDLSWIKSKYKTILQSIGYMNINGRLKVKVLMKEFFRFYDHEFLEILNIDCDECASSNWLVDAFRSNKKKISPLKHLLILRFLGENYISFMSESILPYKPFGIGPWPCLNAVCMYRYEKEITYVELEYSPDTKACRGLFKHGCGYEYYRYEGSSSIKVKNRGILWETKLYEMIKENRSLRSIAKILNCDPKTVIRIANNLCISHRWTSLDERGKDK